jgi:hypothetical protein
MRVEVALNSKIREENIKENCNKQKTNSGAAFKTLQLQI